MLARLAPMRRGWTRGALIAASVVVVLVAGIALGHRLDPTRALAAAHLPRPLPFPLPDFTLVDEEGHTVDAASLRGHVWVADFIFLSCGDTCARLSRRMLALGRRTAGWPAELAPRLISFSVDPDDDAAALRRYRRDWSRAADPRWQLLVADTESLPRLAVALGLADDARDVPDALAVTSRYLFLVDRAGRVRARYDGFRDDEAARLAHDVEALARDEEALP